MILDLDYSAHKKIYIDTINTYCKTHCTTFEYCQDHKLSISDSMMLCGFCQINGLKKWVGYTEKIDPKVFDTLCKERKLET